MDAALVLAGRRGATPQLNPDQLWEPDMTKTQTSTFDSICRLAEIATIAFMLSALPVAAVSFITQSV